MSSDFGNLEGDSDLTHLHILKDTQYGDLRLPGAFSRQLFQRFV